MGDVKYWDTNYGKALDELEAQVKAIKSSSEADREDKISIANQTVRRLQGMKRSYNLEIKLMRDPVSKASFTEEKIVKDIRLADLESKLEDYSNKAGGSERGSLFSGRSSEQEISEKNANYKLDQADIIQNKTEEKYKNMITVLEETEEVGGATAATLREQRDQINKITENVMEIDGLLTRSNKLIKVFSRRLATDKFIQCFSCLNVSAFVAIIIYVVVKKVGLPGSEGTATPPNPLD